MTPITRIEHYLAKMNGEDVEIPVPVTRKEIYFAKICGEDVTIPEPVTIDEKFLYALAGGEVSLPKPVTRLQNIMAKRLGLQAAEIEPITRQEYFWLSGGTSEVWKTVSGSIVSFVTSVAYPMRKLIAKINPVQDLHGYDAPWAAGAGKNKLPMTLANMKTINTDGTWNGNAYTINGVTFTVVVDSDGNAVGVSTSGTASADADCHIYLELLLPAERYTLNGCPSGGSATTYRIFASNIGGDTGDGISGTLDGVKITNVRINIKSGTNVNGLLFKPMIRLESVSDATFAPYSNECPISGWTGLSGYKLNGNLFNGVFGTGETARVEIPSGATAFTATAESTSAKNLLMRFYDSTGTKVGSDVTLISGGTSRNIRSVTIPSGATLFSVYYQSGGSASEFSNVCVGIGGTFSVSWQTEAGTVYGGTVDVVTGVLTVTHKSKVYTGQSSEQWVYSSWSKTLTYCFYSADALTDALTRTGLEYCNELPVTDYNGLKDNDIPGTAFTSTNLTSLRIPKELLASGNSAGIRAYLAEHPLQIVYRLAEPIVYQLTPQQVLTFLGNNTVFVDTGAVEVTYRES